MRGQTMTNLNQSELHTFNENQAARYIGVSSAVTRLWRSQSKGPRYFKAGEKLIRYRKSDLDAWINSRLVTGEQYGPLEDGSK
jgi:predicted DNA-binding transcriptional regulator AlpA